jgi:predicted pyridoxine 5'-phosphate oxidase superfamily flavin-nucleotide-binding protein
MARAFAEIAFTDSVKAAQTRNGSRRAYQKFDMDPERGDRLTEREIEFIALGDSFYMGTVSETGWPYVQHRGGPKGFLKALDDKTLAFADFRGNKQYISIGNLKVDNRVALFIMDYPNQQRLKLWARARLVDRSENPELIAKLQDTNYDARVERAVVFTIEAFDWNCPQHITPRFSPAEVERLMAPVLEENRALKAQLERTAGRPDGPTP